MRFGLNRTRYWVVACCGFLSGGAHAQMPGIPTLAESGLASFDVTSWFGIAAPAKTPRAIIGQLNGSIVRAVNLPDLRARL